MEQHLIIDRKHETEVSFPVWLLFDAVHLR